MQPRRKRQTPRTATSASSKRSKASNIPAPLAPEPRRSTRLDPAQKELQASKAKESSDSESSLSELSENGGNNIVAGPGSNEVILDESSGEDEDSPPKPPSPIRQRTRSRTILAATGAPTPPLAVPARTDSRGGGGHGTGLGHGRGVTQGLSRSTVDLDDDDVQRGAHTSATEERHSAAPPESPAPPRQTAQRRKEWREVAHQSIEGRLQEEKAALRRATLKDPTGSPTSTAHSTPRAHTQNPHRLATPLANHRDGASPALPAIRPPRSPSAEVASSVNQSALALSQPSPPRPSPVVRPDFDMDVDFAPPDEDDNDPPIASSTTASATIDSQGRSTTTKRPKHRLPGFDLGDMDPTPEGSKDSSAHKTWIWPGYKYGPEGDKTKISVSHSGSFPSQVLSTDDMSSRQIKLFRTMARATFNASYAMPDCFAVTMLVPYGNSRSECWTWANDNVTSKVDGFVEQMATKLLEKTRDLRADSAQTQLVKQKREHRIELAASNQRADGQQRRAEHAEIELRRQHAMHLSDGNDSGDDSESSPAQPSRKGKERQNERVRATANRNVQFSNADPWIDERERPLATVRKSGDEPVVHDTTPRSMHTRQRQVDRPRARVRDSTGPAFEHFPTTNWRRTTSGATGSASQPARAGSPKVKAKKITPGRDVDSMDVDDGSSSTSDVAGADEQVERDRRTYTKGELVITAAGPSRTKRGREEIDNDVRGSDKRRKMSEAGPREAESTPAPPPSAAANFAALVSGMTKEELQAAMVSMFALSAGPGTYNTIGDE